MADTHPLWRHDPGGLDTFRAGLVDDWTHYAVTQRFGGFLQGNADGTNTVRPETVEDMCPYSGPHPDLANQTAVDLRTAGGTPVIWRRQVTVTAGPWTQVPRA